MKENPPEGYLLNHKGHLVPESMISDIDLLRNELVNDLARCFKRLRAELIALKSQALDDLMTFCEISAMEYDTVIKGKKGNFSITSFDGRYKVQFQIQERIVFDERLLIARSFIYECVEEWIEGSRKEVKVIIDSAFETDDEGNMSTTKIRSLQNLEIDDPRWIKGMAALTDSMVVIGSKSYIRMYERVEENKAMQAISLNLAAL